MKAPAGGLSLFSLTKCILFSGENGIDGVTPRGKRQKLLLRSAPSVHSSYGKTGPESCYPPSPQLIEGKMMARDDSQHGPVRRKGKGVAGVLISRQGNRGQQRPIFASENFDSLRLDHAEAEETPLETGRTQTARRCGKRDIK